MRIICKPSKKTLQHDFVYDNGEWREDNKLFGDHDLGVLPPYECTYGKNPLWTFQETFEGIQQTLWGELFDPYPPCSKKRKVNDRRVVLDNKYIKIKLGGDFSGLKQELRRRSSGGYANKSKHWDPGSKFYVPTWVLEVGCRSKPRGHDRQGINSFKGMSVSSINIKVRDERGSELDLRSGKWKFQEIDDLSLYTLVGDNDSLGLDAVKSADSSKPACSNSESWLKNLVKQSTSYEGPRLTTFLPFSPDNSHMPWFMRPGSESSEGGIGVSEDEEFSRDQSGSGSDFVVFTDENVPGGSTPSTSPEEFLSPKSSKMPLLVDFYIDENDAVQTINLKGHGDNTLKLHSEKGATPERSVVIDNPQRSVFDRVWIGSNRGTSMVAEKVNITINEYKSYDELIQRVGYDPGDGFVCPATRDRVSMPQNGGEVDIRLVDHIVNPMPTRILQMDRGQKLFVDSQITEYEDIFWSYEKPESSYFAGVLNMHYGSLDSPAIPRVCIGQKFQSLEISFENDGGLSAEFSFI